MEVEITARRAELAEAEPEVQKAEPEVQKEKPGAEPEVQKAIPEEPIFQQEVKVRALQARAAVSAVSAASRYRYGNRSIERTR